MKHNENMIAEAITEFDDLKLVAISSIVAMQTRLERLHEYEKISKSTKNVLEIELKKCLKILYGGRSK